MRERITNYRTDAGMLRLYVTDCASCGVIFAITEELEARRREDHALWYCPNGHSMVFSGPTPAERDAEQARERADRLAAQLRAQMDQTEAAEREAAEARAREVRLKWRVGHGVCPCCSRTFPALAAHVSTKHPEFAHQAFEQLSVRMLEALAWIRRAIDAEDDAIVDAWVVGINWNSVKALKNRGLVDHVEGGRVALTEAGWPLAERALETVR